MEATAKQEKIWPYCYIGVAEPGQEWLFPSPATPTGLTVSIEKVISIAPPEQKDYLICLRETLTRSREINNLLWEDVNFVNRTVTLYTRKKRHGTKTPRVIPMTERLYQTLSTHFAQYDETKPWVFWHLYFSRKAGQVVYRPYQDRKKFMKTLCEKAGVRYFRFHPL